MKNLVISILLSIVIGNLPIWEVGQPIFITIGLFIPCAGFVYLIDETALRIRRALRLRRWVRNLQKKGVNLPR